jgi:WD40 repeat protein
MRTLSAALLLLLAATVPAADLPAGVFDRVGGGGMLHPDRPLAFDFSPDGKHLASAGSDGSVRVWDVKTQTLLHTLSVKDGSAPRLRYSADGKLLFAHFGDDTLRRYAADVAYKPLGTTAARHLDKMSVSADGALAAGLDLADKLKVLEVNTGLERLVLDDGRGVCLAPDGTSVARVSPENVLEVFAIPGGKPLLTVQPAKGEEKALLGELAFSPDGTRVAVAPEWVSGKVRVYEVAGGKAVAAFDGIGPVRFVGNDTLVARRTGKLIVCDLRAPSVTELADRAEAFAVTADGKTIATDNGTGVGSSRLRLWDVATRQEVAAKAGGQGGVLGTATAGGSAWVVGPDRVWRWTPGKKPVEAAKPPARVAAFAATADKLFVASADGVRTVDAKSPGEPALLPNSPKGLSLLAASADGTTLAGAEAGQLVLCDTNGANRRGWALPAVAVGVAVSPNGKLVTVLGRDGFIRVWDTTADPDKPTERWKTKLARSPNGGVTFTPDGTALVVASMLKVVVFEADGGKQLTAYERSWDDGPFVSVAVSADGTLIAAGTLGTNGVAVWERASGTVVTRMTGSKTSLWQLAFADARTLLACGGDGAAVAWDMTDRRGKPAPTADELKAAWATLGHGPRAFWEAGWVFADATDPWPAIADGIAAARKTFADVERNAAKLGDADFDTREKATQALLAAGVAALPAVKAVAENSDLPEAKRRADDLVAKLTALANDPKKAGPTDERSRLRAGVRLAERLGGPKADAALDELTEFGGDVAKEAEAARGRLKK